MSVLILKTPRKSNKLYFKIKISNTSKKINFFKHKLGFININLFVFFIKFKFLILNIKKGILMSDCLTRLIFKIFKLGV